MQTQTEPRFDISQDTGDKLLIEKPQLPTMLNVLTILTFIGSAYGYISGLWSYFQSLGYEKAAAEFEEAQASLADNGNFAAELLEGGSEVLKNQYDYRYILLASALIFSTFCLLGALQMRKLKKTGFIMYTIGEVAPLIVMAATLGFSFISGIGLIFGSFVAVVMVILYATQRKHLKY